MRERVGADLLERDFLVAKIFERPPAFPQERRHDDARSYFKASDRRAVLAQSIDIRLRARRFGQGDRHVVG